MRLIDADKLIEQLTNTINEWIEDMPDGEYLKGNVNFSVIARDMIREQPTAYDLDKVVEQLEEQRKMYEQESEELEKMRDDPNQIIYRRGKMRGFEYSKEIVKDGGIGKNDNK